jgi:diacylglycerol kinase (ATP)
MRLKNPLNGFKYAIEGVGHVFRTQRHMRFHFLVMVFVLLASLIFHLERAEILVLLFTVTLVLMAEMFNTAIEAVVDLVTQTYHPLAKFAKDIAAGAVLIAVINAFVVAILLFFGGRDWSTVSKDVGGISKPTLSTIVVVGLILLGILVVMWKVRGRKGKLWKGGVVSAHTAIGFFLCTTIYWLSHNTAVAILAFAMAVLIAQSRVEAKIHTLREVVIGALLATILTGAVYWFISSPK